MLFLVAFIAALLMGFANQRGGTCTVAAIEEILAERQHTRFIALIEASFWVAAGLLLLGAIHHLPPTPGGFSVGIATIIGSILFGIGAFVNRACLFGSVARLGSGEWAYLATPFGFYLGAALGNHLPPPTNLNARSLLHEAPLWLAIFTGAILALRILSHGASIRRSPQPMLGHIWSPHVATIVIGLTFLTGFLSAGAWTYGELLVDAARGNADEVASKFILNVGLLAGAVLGGWSARCLRFAVPSRSAIAKAGIGGAIMGVGGTLIPGGNTGLILMGMPLLWPYAWLAFLIICLTIYSATRCSMAGRVRNPPATDVESADA
jgi:toxin CptA